MGSTEACSSARRSLPAVEPPELVLGTLERPPPRGGQVPPGPVYVEVEHRHCGLERARFLRRLRSAERRSDSAIARGLRSLNTSISRSSALLRSVTSRDQRRVLRRARMHQSMGRRWAPSIPPPRALVLGSPCFSRAPRLLR